MFLKLPACGIAPRRAPHSAYGPRLGRRARRFAAPQLALAGLALTAGTLGTLFAGQADASVQRIELSQVADHRAQEMASALQARQALLDQADVLDLAASTATMPAPAVANPLARASELALAMRDAATPEGLAAAQLADAEQLRARVDERAATAETAIRRLGLNPRLLVAKQQDRAAQGGPLVGSARGLGAPFERLAASLAKMEALEASLATIPHDLPASLEYISSGFGYRSDPFSGEAAMHSGLDFRGPVGAPIYAAADGRVSFAGVKNGYGNCIEISHGNGMVTRYAHMSKFVARLGDTVEAGQAIGAIGSTGRSTGPHLHFEVRINDQAVNPRPFLEAKSRAARS